MKCDEKSPARLQCERYERKFEEKRKKTSEFSSFSRFSALSTEWLLSVGFSPAAAQASAWMFSSSSSSHCAPTPENGRDSTRSWHWKNLSLDSKSIIDEWNFPAFSRSSAESFLVCWKGLGACVRENFPEKQIFRLFSSLCWWTWKTLLVPPRPCGGFCVVLRVCVSGKCGENWAKNHQQADRTKSSWMCVVFPHIFPSLFHPTTTRLSPVCIFFSQAYFIFSPSSLFWLWGNVFGVGIGLGRKEKKGKVVSHLFTAGFLL